MTHEELLAIKARAEAATPEPWTEAVGKIAGETRELIIGPNDDVIVAIAYGGFGNPVDRTREDRTFITHARTDVPNLVAEVERLRGVVDRLGSSEAFTLAMYIGDDDPRAEEIVARMNFAREAMK